MSSTIFRREQYRRVSGPTNLEKNGTQRDEICSQFVGQTYTCLIKRNAPWVSALSHPRFLYIYLNSVNLVIFCVKKNIV